MAVAAAVSRLLHNGSRFKAQWQYKNISRTYIVKSSRAYHGTTENKTIRNNTVKRYGNKYENNSKTEMKWKRYDRATIVQRKRNVNFLLAATVPYCLCTCTYIGFLLYMLILHDQHVFKHEKLRKVYLLSVNRPVACKQKYFNEFVN